MPGLMGPERYPIRDPKDSGQINGRCVNPVRYPEMGGLDSPGAWFGGDKGKTNNMRLEKPTSVRAAKSTANTSDD